MAATTLDASHARAHLRPGVGVSDSRIFRAAVTLIILHIVDDEFLHRAPGTSIDDHLRAGLLPIGVALLAAWVYPRLRPGLQAGTALIFGILGIVAGMIAVGGASADGVSVSDLTGVLGSSTAPTSRTAGSARSVYRLAQTF